MFVELFAKNWELAAKQEAAVRREFSAWMELEVAAEPVATEERREELKPRAAARVARCLVEQAGLAGLQRLAVKVERAEPLARSRAWRSLRIAGR
jgi:hypothetical protein